MSRVQWRRFAFFEKDNVVDNIKTTLGVSPCCASSEGGMLLFGNVDGSIVLADRSAKMLWKHKAFKGEVMGLAYILDPQNPRRQFVFAVGDEFIHKSDANEGSDSTANRETYYMCKIYNSNDMSRPLHVFHASVGVASTATIKAFAVMPDGCQIAIGFSSGSVLLFSGAFLKDSSPTTASGGSVNRMYQPEVLLQRERQDRVFYPVSGLHFYEKPSKTPVENDNDPRKGKSVDRDIRLFVVMDTLTPLPAHKSARAEGKHRQHHASELDVAGIIVFQTGINSSSYAPIARKMPVILDEIGALPLCSMFMKDSSELMVARTEGVFSYSCDDRGAAAGIEGAKQCLCVIERYVLIANADDKKDANYRSAITIYDLRNKYISHYLQLPAGDRALFTIAASNCAYVVTSSWNLMKFTVKDTNTKLEVLLRKNLYPLAISLSMEEHCEVAEIMKLRKYYGDYLFKKAEYEAAVAQYCITIGFVQSSYVIRKFLDVSLINYLVVYLEKLHDKGLASKDHTILLLSCLTRSNTDEKLNQFIELLEKSTTSSANSVRKSLQFDIDTAITTLYNSGSVEHAVNLAKKYQQHEVYIKMQLFRSSGTDIDGVLAYLILLVFQLPMSEILHMLQLFGRELLAITPVKMTNFLVRMCNGDFLDIYKSITSTNVSSGNVEGDGLAPGLILPTEKLNIEELLPLYVDDDSNLLVLLEGVFAPNNNFRTGEKSKLMKSLPLKISHTFLELYFRKYDEICNKLATKAYLSEEKTDSEALNAQIASLKKCISGILTNPLAEFDVSHVLLLSHAYGIESAQNDLLYRNQHSVNLLMRKYIEQNKVERVLKLLSLEGANDPELFVVALRYCMKRCDPTTLDNMVTMGGDSLATRRFSVNRQVTTADDASSSNSEGESGSSGSSHSESEGESDSDVSDEEDRNIKAWEKADRRQIQQERKRWRLLSKVIAKIMKTGVLSLIQIISICSESENVPFSIISSFVIETLSSLSEEVAEEERQVQSMVQTVSKLTEDEAVRRKGVTSNSQHSRSALNGVRAGMKLKKEDISIGSSGVSNKHHSNSRAASLIRGRSAGRKFNPFVEIDDDAGDEYDAEDAFDQEMHEDEEGALIPLADDYDEEPGSRVVSVSGTEKEERLKEYQKWDSILKAQLSRATDHESFFSELEQSVDGFSAVASYFGKTAVVLENK